MRSAWGAAPFQKPRNVPNKVNQGANLVGLSRCETV